VIVKDCVFQIPKEGRADYFGVGASMGAVGRPDDCYDADGDDPHGDPAVPEALGDKDGDLACFLVAQEQAHALVPHVGGEDHLLGLLGLVQVLQGCQHHQAGPPVLHLLPVLLHSGYSRGGDAQTNLFTQVQETGLPDFYLT
jgi:hypothetical protein